MNGRDETTEMAQEIISALMWDSTIKVCMKGGGTRIDCLRKIRVSLEESSKYQMIPPAQV